MIAKTPTEFLREYEAAGGARSVDALLALIADDAALCVYEFDWSGEISGKPASGSGRGTTEMRCDDGAWRIIHKHLSRGRLNSG